MLTFKEVVEFWNDPMESIDKKQAAFVKPTHYGRLEGWNLEAVKEWLKDADKVLEEFALSQPDGYEDELKEWCENYWPGRWVAICNFVSEWQGYHWHDTPSMLASWKTAETGHKWAVWECMGYTQSDWGSVIYDTKAHSDKDARRIGDYALGCYTEYALTEGEDHVYGYFVSDTDGNLSDADTKAYLAECEGCNPEDVKLLRVWGGKNRNFSMKMDGTE